MNNNNTNEAKYFFCGGLIVTGNTEYDGQMFDKLGTGYEAILNIECITEINRLVLEFQWYFDECEFDNDAPLSIPTYLAGVYGIQMGEIYITIQNGLATLAPSRFRRFSNMLRERGCYTY